MQQHYEIDSLCARAYTATLRVTDDDGGAGTDTAVITVVDITPPEISVTVTPDTLWPPNHKYVTVTATVIVSDLVDTDPTISLRARECMKCINLFNK